MDKTNRRLYIANICLGMIIVGLLIFFAWQLRKISFVQNLLATLIGVFVGASLAVIGALWVDRRNSQRTKSERQDALLQLFLEALDANEKAVRGFLEGNADRRSILTFAFLDLAVLDSTVSLKYEVIDDLSLNKILDSIRYVLKNLRESANIWLKRSYQDPLARADSEDPQVVELFKSAVENVISDIKRARAIITARFGTNLKEELV